MLPFEFISCILYLSNFSGDEANLHFWSGVVRQNVDGIPTVSPEDVFGKIGKVKIIDVRRPEEFNKDLGHISTAELITLGPELTNYLKNRDRTEEIVFVCRSGGRSSQATEESLRLDYKFTVNMTGGMLSWNEKSLTTEGV